MTEIAMIINCLRLDQGFRVEIAELIGQSHVFHPVASTPIMAVRSALTDDGHPPLCASGLKLHDRLAQISDSLARVEEKRGHFLRP